VYGRIAGANALPAALLARYGEQATAAREGERTEERAEERT
jgi:hypothetical protein